MTKSKRERPTTQPVDWPWPEALDALVAAPDHHVLMLENERVRVLSTCIAAGDRTPVHTHRWPAVFYLLSWSHFVRYDDQGRVMVDSRQVEALKEPPEVLWSAPLPPHSLENVGESDLELISVELKDPD
ncbi:MAG: cupin domain-containing protein [Anaerolineales bacterium]|jgi:hypothetical protein